MSWRWLDSARRYYNDDTKRFMSRQDALGRVEASLNNGRNQVDTLADFVANGQIDPNDWRSQMQMQIKDEYIRQYMFGRGGRNRMTPSDWGSIGGMLAEQSPFLNAFTAEIEAGLLSEGQISTRAQMYINSAREAYERGKSISYGIAYGALPAYPGDGSTVCLTNDQCSWTIVQIQDENGSITGWECYWTLSPDAAHCTTCVTNATQWNPYILSA